MSSTLLISVLLSIVAFVGALMVKQLMKIADAVQAIQVEIKVLANDFLICCTLSLKGCAK